MITYPSTIKHRLITSLILFITSATVNAATGQQQVHPMTLSQKIHAVEARLAGRVGVSVLKNKTGEIWSYNGNQRFPVLSTYKAFACSAILARVDMGQTKMDQTISLRQKDLTSYSPVTKAFAGKSMTLEQLCDAAMTQSDNTAANLILGHLGGPQSVTNFMRSIGDTYTVISRWEPQINEATPGDNRDTTIPNAATRALKKLYYGNLLSVKAKNQLMKWMLANQTGDNLIRSVVPRTWRVADRTGTGEHGSRAVIAVLIPPKKSPLIMSIYITQTKADLKTRDDAIAEISKAIIDAL